MGTAGTAPMLQYLSSAFITVLTPASFYLLNKKNKKNQHGKVFYSIYVIIK
jgi:hypothetical protein